jgi:hypothetical protein
MESAVTRSGIEFKWKLLKNVGTGLVPITAFQYASLAQQFVHA